MGVSIEEKVVEIYTGLNTEPVKQTKAADSESAVAQPETVLEDNNTEKGEN